MILAAVLVLPAALFVGANVLKYGLGIDGPYDVLGPLTDPPKGAGNVVTAIVLVGPVIGLAIALSPVLRLRFAYPDGEVQGSVSLRLRWVNIAIAVVALGVLAVLFGHILAENAACWFGNETYC
jgi:hypothetical protein